MHCNQIIWSRANYEIVNDLFKMKGQEASSWLRWLPEKLKLSLRYSMIQCTLLARRRREKIILFTLIRVRLLYGACLNFQYIYRQIYCWDLRPLPKFGKKGFQGLRPWNHLLAWGGSKMLSRGEGQKMASRGGRLAICPPHAHLFVQRIICG